MRRVNQIVFTLVAWVCCMGRGIASAGNLRVTDTLVTSTQEQAIAFMDQLNELAASPFWPNIRPGLFLKNLESNIHNPISIYAGSGTNFCGYGALTYLYLLDDPLGYAKLMLQLYYDGRVTSSTVSFHPSPSVKIAAGQLRYKGILDIHHADQMWFLSLADHFKGYLNFFNQQYDPGDEDRLWASVNYAKFNRMVRELLHYKIGARGADLIRLRVADPYKYISERMKTGTVVLFINNRIVHKRNHTTLKLGIPTHFIVVEKISEENNVITLIYWDYGGKTLLQLSPAFFKRIIFGISVCSKNGTNVN